MKTNVASKIFPWHSLILWSAFLIFLLAMLLQTRNYPYYRDDSIVFKRAQETLANPLAAWAPVPEYGRRHPLWFYLLSLEKIVLGFNATGYFTILFLLHFFNSLLVVRLCRSLGGTLPAQVLSGLLFLYSSCFYQNLILIPSTQRVLCLLFSLLAMSTWIEFLRNRRFLHFLYTALLQTFSLLSMEDMVVFPLLALFFTWILVREDRERKAIALRFVLPLVLINVLLSLVLLEAFFSSPLRAEKLPEFKVPVRQIMGLLRMLFLPLFVPEKGFLPPGVIPENFLRLIPVSLFALIWLTLLSVGKSLKSFLGGFPSQFVFISLGWIGITVLPFIFQSSTFEHVNRYLYSPMVGFSLIFGVSMNRLTQAIRSHSPLAGLISFIVTMVYILALNLSTTIYHYQRYLRHVEIHTEQRFYQQVEQIFEEGKGRRVGLLPVPELSDYLRK